MEGWCERRGACWCERVREQRVGVLLVCRVHVRGGCDRHGACGGERW